MQIIAVLSFSSVSWSQTQDISQSEKLASRQVNKFDTIWGQVIEDEYIWMENSKDDSLHLWLKTQHDEVEAFKMDNYKKLYKKLDQIARYSTPIGHKKGKYYFDVVRENSDGPPVMYMSEYENGNYSLLFDPRDIDKSKTYMIWDYEISENSEVLAVFFTELGSKWNTIMFFDLKKRKWLKDKLTMVMSSDFIWHNNGLFYTKYDNEAAVINTPKNTKYRGLYYHNMCTTQDADKLIYKAKDDSDLFTFDISHSKNYLVLYREVLRKEANYSVLSQISLPLQSEIQFQDFYYQKKIDFRPNIVGETENGLLVNTDYKAPFGAVYNYEPKKLNQASIIVPQDSSMLSEVWQVQDKLLMSYFKNGQNILVVYSTNGEFLKSIAIEFGYTVNEVNESEFKNKVLLDIGNLYSPPMQYHLDIKTGEITLAGISKVEYDVSLFTTRMVNYSSKDGTIIPMFLLSKNKVDLKNENPTLLIANAGFGCALPSKFRPSIVTFMHYDGVIAVPQVRGGGDFPKWHEQGKRHNKQNAIDDIIAASEYLIKEKISSPEKLALQANGYSGVIASAAMVQEPELYQSVVIDGGMTDMVRYHHFNLDWGFDEEFGTTEDSIDFKHLIAYSPLHNVKDNVKYPSTLLVAAENDQFIYPFHSYKLQAKLKKSAQSSTNPHLLLPLMNHSNCACYSYKDF